ncbi:pilus assembly protein PilM [Aneurinibacillus sp. BA2021]|nr:pilus assembly protein PilM [Aneurinibacillus sp. BA2021]
MKFTLPNVTLPRFSLTLPSVFSRKKTGCVGIVLEDGGLRYAEVRHGSNVVEVKNAGFIELDSGIIERGKIIVKDQLEMQLGSEMRDRGLRGKKAVLSVPGAAIFIRKVSLPSVPEREVPELLEVELETTVHVPFPRPYFDYYKLGVAETDANREEEEIEDEYLVIAAPGDLIDQYIDLFKLLNIELNAVEIEPLALYRMLEQAGVSEEDNHFMVVQLGIHDVNVAFFHGEIPEFVRNIPIDLANYRITNDERNMNSHAMFRYMEERGMFGGFANDLVRELERVLSFYEFNISKNGERVQKIYLTGDFPGMQEMVGILANRIEHAEIMPFPVEHIEHELIDEDVQAYTVPIGLSMRG